MEFWKDCSVAKEIEEMGGELLKSEKMLLNSFKCSRTSIGSQVGLHSKHFEVDTNLTIDGI